MEIAYAAHTRTCTFLLDSEGICRDVVGPDGVSRHAGPTAERCIGAQYVASLDAESRGILVDMPRIGLPIVFARVDSRGRVSLVRTGNLLRLEPRRASQRNVQTTIERNVTVEQDRTPRRLPLPTPLPMPTPFAQDVFDDARTRRFDLPPSDRAPQTMPMPPYSTQPATERLDRHYDGLGRARRTSDIVPTYEERESIFPPSHETQDFREEPLSPYAIPLRRVR